MPDIIQHIKDIVTIIAACSAIFIGFSGLNSWKKQLQGTANYDLSKKLITSLFIYRDAIKHVRNPTLYNHEIKPPTKEQSKGMSKDKIEFFGYSKAYQNRWDRVDEAKKEFYADRIQGEAVWGKPFVELFKDIPLLEHELFMAIQTDLVLRNPESSKDKKDAWDKLSRKKRDIMYDTSFDEKPDEFMSDLNKAIGKIEEYLKPHLKK